MKSFVHLAMRLYGTPLLLDPMKAAVIEDVFIAYCLRGADFDERIEALQAVSHVPSPMSLAPGVDVKRAAGGYLLTSDGVALIPMMGPLVHRATGMDAFCGGMKDYGALRGELGAAMHDSAVRGILLEVDSPGGEVAGCFDLTDQIAAYGAEKPIHAIANDMAASAAYALASSAANITATRTARVGSIGVMVMHQDRSKADEKRGLSYTTIVSGNRKNDNSPHAPMPEAVRTHIQGEVDRLGGIFHQTVARGRKMDASAVRDMQAATYNADDAKQHRLIDQIGTYGDALGEITDAVNAGARSHFLPAVPQGPAALSGPLTPKGNAMTPEEIAAQAAAAKKVTDDAAAAKATADANKAAATAERTRVKAIMGHEHAKDRQALANHLAFETDMTPEAAAGVMQFAGKEGVVAAAAQAAAVGATAAAAPAGGTAAAGTNQFAAHMASLGNPQVGADNGAAAAAADDPAARGAAAAMKYSTRRKLAAVTK